MNIRKTTEQDFETVMAIYAHARAFMAEHGNPNQWGPTHWPPEALIHADIAAGKSYVCEHAGRIVGTFFFDQGRDIEPTYAGITGGAWRDESPYGVVHRIASDGTVRGTGAFCIDWAYARCRHLRIDTHGDNCVMQGLLKKLGFIPCGTIYVREDNDPRIAFEKSEAFREE
ncbi:MAG: GNAT family N-acetyltransferase [Clostridia bacterium]|nr:GNAT family N-acetyltransferase [Clostridia bacterium]